MYFLLYSPCPFTFCEMCLFFFLHKILFKIGEHIKEINILIETDQFVRGDGHLKFSGQIRHNSGSWCHIVVIFCMWSTFVPLKYNPTYWNRLFWAKVTPWQCCGLHYRGNVYSTAQVDRKTLNPYSSGRKICKINPGEQFMAP